MDDLLKESTARDFVADAFAHCKFIGYVEAAVPLFEKAGIAERTSTRAFIALASPEGCRPALSASSASCGFGTASRSVKMK